MSEPKVHCTQCGAEILAATAARTGGICMACKNGRPSEWARRQLWLKHGLDPHADIPWYRTPWAEEILATCHKLVASQIGCVEGSHDMVAASCKVFDDAHGDKWIHKDWKIFFTVTWREKMGDDLEAVDNACSEQVHAAALKLLRDAEEFEQNAGTA